MRIQFKCPECKTIHLLKLPYRFRNRTHKVTVNCYVCEKENVFIYAKRLKERKEG